MRIDTTSRSLSPMAKRDFAERMAERVRTFRVEQDRTLESVAGPAGLSIGALSEIEHGLRWRRVWLDIERLAKALKKTPRELFPGES